MPTPIATPTITLGSIPMNQKDDYGVTWAVSSLSGWDSPTVRVAAADSPGSHGTYGGPSLYGARSLTLEGTFVAPNEFAMRAAREQLSAATNALVDTRLQVDEGFPKFIYVQRSGVVATKAINKTAVQFQVPLIASDPRKYSVGLSQAMMALTDPNANSGIVFPRVFPTTSWGVAPRAWHIMASNDGNFESRPLIAFTGSMTSPVAMNLSTGRTIALDLTLYPGTVLTVDIEDRTALLDGTSRRYALTRNSSWWVLAPGLNEIAFYAEDFSDDARLTVMWRSAWL